MLVFVSLGLFALHAAHAAAAVSTSQPQCYQDLLGMVHAEHIVSHIYTRLEGTHSGVNGSSWGMLNTTKICMLSNELEASPGASTTSWDGASRKLQGLAHSHSVYAAVQVENWLAADHSVKFRKNFKSSDRTHILRNASVSYEINGSGLPETFGASATAFQDASGQIFPIQAAGSMMQQFIYGICVLQGTHAQAQPNNEDGRDIYSVGTPHLDHHSVDKGVGVDAEVKMSSSAFVSLPEFLLYGFTFGTLTNAMDGSNYDSAQTMTSSGYILHGAFNSTNHTFICHPSQHIIDLDVHLVQLLSECAHMLEVYRTTMWRLHVAIFCILILSIILALLMWLLASTVWSSAHTEAIRAADATLHAHVKDEAIQTHGSFVRSAKRRAKCKRHRNSAPAVLDRFRQELVHALYNDSWAEWVKAFGLMRKQSEVKSKSPSQSNTGWKVETVSRVKHTHKRSRTQSGNGPSTPQFNNKSHRAMVHHYTRRPLRNAWYQCACEHGCPVWIYRLPHEVNAMCSRCFMKSKGTSDTCPGSVGRVDGIAEAPVPDAPARVIRGHRGAGFAAARVAHSLTFLLHTFLFCTIVTPAGAVTVGNTLRLVPVNYILITSGVFSASIYAVLRNATRVWNPTVMDWEDWIAIHDYIYSPLSWITNPLFWCVLLNILLLILRVMRHARARRNEAQVHAPDDDQDDGAAHGDVAQDGPAEDTASHSPASTMDFTHECENGPVPDFEPESPPQDELQVNDRRPYYSPDSTPQTSPSHSDTEGFESDSDELSDDEDRKTIRRSVSPVRMPTTPSSSATVKGVEGGKGIAIPTPECNCQDWTCSRWTTVSRNTRANVKHRNHVARGAYGWPGLGMSKHLQFMCIMSALITTANAVTCHTCFDQIPGCTGGDACLLLTTPRANTAVIAGGAGLLTLVNLLPIKFLRECTRSILDCLKMVANRPVLGTPIDLSAPTTNVEELIGHVQSGRATPGDAAREAVTRLTTATTQIEIARLNGLANFLNNMEKANGVSMMGGVTRGGIALGSFTLVWALSGKITRQSLAIGIAGVVESAAEASSPAVQVVKLSILRPRTLAEFSDMLTIWFMICHSTGVGNILVLGEFVRDVVHDTMLKHNHSWQVAHELFLVYLEAVETSSDDSVTIRNIYVNGSQDTFLKRAQDSAAIEYGSTNVKKAGEPQKDTDDRKGGQKWNGNHNKKATMTCHSFNMGLPHPARSLDEKGTCKFLHTCDQWVSDKGPGGTCGGNHPRFKCKNPNKCDEKVTK